MRPKKDRIIKSPPKYRGFKPVGIPANILEKVNLSIDEYEAIRLADYEKLDHEKAAEKMGISRPTFTRLIDSARKKVADAIINGKELLIDGGNIHFRNDILRCIDCGFFIEVSMLKPQVKFCPECGSPRIVSLSNQFGHGRCCRNRFRGL